MRGLSRCVLGYSQWRAWGISFPLGKFQCFEQLRVSNDQHCNWDVKCPCDRYEWHHGSLKICVALGRCTNSSLEYLGYIVVQSPIYSFFNKKSRLCSLLYVFPWTMMRYIEILYCYKICDAFWYKQPNIPIHSSIKVYQYCLGHSCVFRIIKGSMTRPGIKNVTFDNNNNLYLILEQNE